MPPVGGPSGRQHVQAILKQHGANDDELDKASRASAPDGSDLIYVDQLGSDEAAARKTLAQITSREEIVAALLSAWKATSQGGATPAAPPKPTDPPRPGAPAGPAPVTTLTASDPPPAGVADLSHGVTRIIANPNAIDQVVFKLPDIVTGPVAPKGTVVLPVDVKWTEWLRVAITCNLTKAIRLVPGGRDWPARHAFRWKLDGPAFSTLTQADLKDGGLQTSLQYTTEEHQAFKQSLAEGSLNASYLFATASASGSWKSQVAQETRTKRLYLGLKEMRPVAQIDLVQSLEVTPELRERIAAICAAAEAPAGTVEGAFDPLLALLDEFGHVVPSEVVLGGCFFHETIRNVKQWAEAHADTLKASFKIAAQSPGAAAGQDRSGGGASGGWADDRSDWQTQEHMREDILTFAVGGDDRQIDPKEWRGSLTGPDTWRVIEYRAKKVGKDAAGKTIPVYESLLDRLPEDLLKKKVRTIWDAGRDRAWNPSHAKAVNRLPDSVAHAVPLFWTAQGVQPVTMLSMSRAAPPVLQAANGASGVYVARPPRVIPVEHQPHLIYEDEPPIPAQRVPVVAKEPPAADRTMGTWWQHCDPAPLRLDASRATDVGASRALWRFEYTGDITHEGHPLYWIVTGDGGWLLSGFDDKGNHALWANLLHAAGRDRQLPGSSPAAWAVFPADPSGLHAGRLDGCYVLWNPVLKAFLGPEGTLQGRRGWYEPAHEERHFDTSPGAPGFEQYRPVAKQIQVPLCDRDEPDIAIARTLLKPFGEGASGRAADALSALYAAEHLEEFCWELKPYTG